MKKALITLLFIIPTLVYAQSLTVTGNSIRNQDKNIKQGEVVNVAFTLAWYEQTDWVQVSFSENSVQCNENNTCHIFKVLKQVKDFPTQDGYFLLNWTVPDTANLAGFKCEINNNKPAYFTIIEGDGSVTDLVYPTTIQEGTYQIFTLTGCKVSEFKGSSPNEFNTPGVYIYTVTTVSGQVGRGKLVVQ